VSVVIHLAEGSFHLAICRQIAKSLADDRLVPECRHGD
jgi:hypothetical protein